MSAAPVLTVARTHEHDWRLRDTEELDGVQVRRFECDGCRGVDYF